MSRPSSTGASTSTCRPIPRCRHKGGCFPHPPAAGMCPGKSPSPRCCHPKLALLEFKCAGMSWGARRGDRADTSPARGVLVPPSGALQTLWSWEGRIPAGIIPATPHPSMARPPHPAEPPCAALGVRGQGVFGAGGPRAGRALRFHSRAGFMEQAGFQLGPSQNQPIRYSPISDWALQHPQSRGGGEVAQTHSSCPPQPVSLRNQLWARGVRALVGEQRVGPY